MYGRNHPGRRITQYEIGELFARAYSRAATVDNAEQAFVRTGIANCDLNIFRDYEFAPSDVG